MLLKKNDQISNTQIVKVSLPKTSPSLSQTQEKLETCRNSNVRNFGRSSLGDYIRVTFISYPLGPLSLHNLIYVTNFVR